MSGLEVLGPIFAALGSVTSGLASYSAAQAQVAQQEQVARIADENAKRAGLRAQIEQQDQDFQTRAMLGQQLAEQSASGLDIGFGSTKYARIAGAQVGRRDALNVRQEGDIQVNNFQNQAAGARAQAAASENAGTFALLGSFLKAGSVIGGAESPSRRTYGFTPPVRPQVLS